MVFRNSEVRDHRPTFGNPERAVASKFGVANRCSQQMPTSRVILECSVREKAQGASVFAPEQFYDGQQRAC